MDPGEAQAKRAAEFVRRRLGYGDVTEGEHEIKKLLNMKLAIEGKESKCADIVGFKPSFSHAMGAIVCESKGTGVDRSLLQLGNVAAAILDHFDPASWLWNNLTLLVYRSKTVRLAIGDSPGPSYLVGNSVPSGLRVLLHAGTDETPRAPAVANIDLQRLEKRLTRWGPRVAMLPVYVYVEP